MDNSEDIASKDKGEPLVKTYYQHEFAEDGRHRVIRRTETKTSEREVSSEWAGPAEICVVVTPGEENILIGITPNHADAYPHLDPTKVHMYGFIQSVSVTDIIER